MKSRKIPADNINTLKLSTLDMFGKLSAPGVCDKNSSGNSELW